MTKKTDGHSQLSGDAKKWLHLAFGLFLLWAFIFLLAPMLQQKITSLGILSSYINESGIPAGALYYTEVDEVGESDQAIRNTFRFFIKHE